MLYRAALGSTANSIPPEVKGFHAASQPFSTLILARASRNPGPPAVSS